MIHPVNIILLLPECDVCGQGVDSKFLQQWNDQQVCRKCIQDLEEEYHYHDKNQQARN